MTGLSSQPGCGLRRRQMGGCQSRGRWEAHPLPAKVVREVDAFTHLPSDHGKHQGPCHHAPCLATVLQETPSPELQSQGVDASHGTFSCQRHVPFGPKASEPHLLPECTWNTPAAPAPPGSLSGAPEISEGKHIMSPRKGFQNAWVLGGSWPSVFQTGDWRSPQGQGPWGDPLDGYQGLEAGVRN